MKRKDFTFTLSRTRVQSAECTIRARSAHEAESLLVDFIDGQPDTDQLTHDAMAFTPWSAGEDEGAIDYDYDGEGA